MIRTIEAIVDECGDVRLLEEVTISGTRRALVTILEELPGDSEEPAFLSETVLDEDWNRPEEDAAWSHLSQAS